MVRGAPLLSPAPGGPRALRDAGHSPSPGTRLTRSELAHVFTSVRVLLLAASSLCAVLVTASLRAHCLRPCLT